jgi:peptidoglycan hydrolase-like protein with peptidoglycan-binding domain
MALQSQLFGGVRELEAAAVSDPAHITQGANGPHVAKIQQALVQLDGATIAQDGAYGSRTAAAVSAFKQKRQILNFQGKIDDIVGKKTMAALDAEMLAKEGGGPAPGEVIITIVGPNSLPQVGAPPQGQLQFAVAESTVLSTSQSLQTAPGTVAAPRTGAPPRKPKVTVLAITGTPEMPLMSFQANVRGADPTVVFQTTFNWVLQISFNASACRNGPNRTINQTIRQSDTGAVLIPILRIVRGGSLTVSVSATINGKVIRDRMSGIQIVATNPTRTAVFNALPNKTMRRMVLQESGGKQFAAAANGGVGPCPLWSGDRLGGVGLFQITLPRPKDDEVWNWRSNIAGGLDIFAKKLAVARGYPTQVRTSAGFQQLVRAFNADRRTRRLPPLTITLPEFTSGDFDDNLQQLELDAIRGFNGFAGGDGLGHPLHEFRVALQRGRLKVVNIDEQAKTGEAEWERVPASQRPQKTGDPNYVARVLGQQI